jgi:hypothetical protein
VEKSSERLVTAYQEGLLTLSQLRQRMPALQKQTQAVESELQSLKMAAVDETRYLQLAASLTGFRSKLRVRAAVLDIAVRQQILRLLVKAVLVGKDTITLRHSIPIPQSGPGSNGSPAPPSGSTGSKPNPGYLLRSGSRHCPLWPVERFYPPGLLYTQGALPSIGFRGVCDMDVAIFREGLIVRALLEVYNTPRKETPFAPVITRPRRAPI